VRDLVVARPPDVAALAEAGEDSVEYPHSGGVARESFLQTDNHHGSALGTFPIQLVELVDKLLLVVGRCEAGKSKLAMSSRCTEYGTVANGSPLICCRNRSSARTLIAIRAPAGQS
jgi:hypothetical protein